MAGVFLRLWTDLPDPRDPHTPHGGRTRVILLEDTLRHIVDKHIKNKREPWKDVLTRDQRRALERWANGEVLSEEDHQHFDEAIETLGWQLGQSLRRPMVLLYRRRLKAGGFHREFNAWCLVLPRGPVAFAWETTGGATLKTCYFPVATVVFNSERRWQKTATMLVRLYGEFRQNGIYPPGPNFSRVREFQGESWVETDIRFVTLDQWGFSTNIPGSPWRGAFGTWEGEEVKPRKVQRRLRPRKPPSEGDLPGP